MRIAILNLTAGGMSGGYRKYLKNIIPRMATYSDVNSILCASPKSLNVRDWFEPIRNVTFVGCLPFRLRRTYDFDLIKRLDEFSPDIIFIPMERYIKYMNIPIVNMVQNMLPMVSIGNNIWTERLRNYVQKMVGKKAIARSDRVIAVSKYVQEFLHQEWSVPIENIGLVYHGVDLIQDVKSIRPITVPGEWENKFIFTAGSIDPYRGLEDILFATGTLVSQGLDVKVVIAGNARPLIRGYLKKLQDLVNKLKIASKICWAGYLNEEEMSWCYQNCIAFLMTSRVEACPNIALEAMSHGCITVCTDNPPLPEIFGDSAIFYSPYEKNSLLDAILKLNGLDDERRNKLSIRAVQRATGFSWDKTAERTLIELKKVIKRVS